MSYQTPTNAAASAQPDEAGFYHIYTKSCRDRVVFREPADNLVFLALLKQYLRLQKLVNPLERLPSNSTEVELHAYNIRPKNFQLLLRSPAGIATINPIIKAVILSYEGYFARKYRNLEPLFYDVYKSTKVPEIETAVALSQALHHERLGWAQSSRDYYLGKEKADWIQAGLLIMAAGGKVAYRRGAAQAKRIPRRLQRSGSNLLLSFRSGQSPAVVDKLLVDNLGGTEWSLHPDLL